MLNFKTYFHSEKPSNLFMSTSRLNLDDHQRPDSDRQKDLAARPPVNLLSGLSL